MFELLISSLITYRNPNVIDPVLAEAEHLVPLGIEPRKGRNYL